MRVLIEQTFEGQHHSRRAKPALDTTTLDHGLLDRMQGPRFTQPLDGDDVSPFGLERQDHAGVHGLSVQEHRATATITGTAAFFGAGQTQVDAQGIEQAGSRSNFD